MSNPNTQHGKGDKHESPAVRSLRKEQKTQSALTPEQELEKGLKDTFPASDPVAPTLSTTAGNPEKRSAKKP